MPKTYRYSTLDDVLQALNEERSISREDVRPSLLGTTIHIGLSGIGAGYMPDSYTYCRSRRALVDAHCDTARMYDDYAERVPAGFRRSLMAGCGAWSRDGRTYFEVDTITISEVIRG